MVIKIMDRNEINKKMYVLKAISILFVVLAHTNCDLINNSVDFYLVKRLSAVGVFVFFFLSGYYFKSKKWKNFLINNISGLVVPWLFLGTINFVFGEIKSGSSINIFNYIKYILGIGSMYYFCTVLLILKILMNLLEKKVKKPYVYYVFICISVLSTVFSNEFSDVIQEHTFGIVTPYLNLFNWIGVFSLGCLARNKDYISKFADCSRKLKITALMFTVLILIIGYKDCEFGYFGRFSFLCEFGIMLCIGMFVFSFKKNCLIIRIFENIGKDTLTIYLLHYPLLSVMQKISLLNGSIFFIFMRCFICASMIAAFANLVGKYFNNSRFLWVKTLLGIK